MSQLGLVGHSTGFISKTAVESFAGMTVYYRMFIMGYARYMRPLHNLVKDDPESKESAMYTARPRK